MSSYRALTEAVRALRDCCERLREAADDAGPNVSSAIIATREDVLAGYTKLRKGLVDIESQVKPKASEDDAGEVAYERECWVSKKDVA